MFSLMPKRERRELARPFEWFEREFAPLFDRAFPSWPAPVAAPLETPFWGLEMEEKENEYVVRAEVPGFEASELVVNLNGNMLTIRAEHKAAREGKEEVERRFERTFTVPTGVIPEKVEALYRNGVLEVHLPGTPEPEGRRIEVKV